MSVVKYQLGSTVGALAQPCTEPEYRHADVALGLPPLNMLVPSSFFFSRETCASKADTPRAAIGRFDRPLTFGTFNKFISHRSGSTPATGATTTGAGASVSSILSPAAASPFVFSAALLQ